MSTTPHKPVLLIGLVPEVVDFTEVPGLDEHKLAAGLKLALEQTRAAGFDAEWCLTTDRWDQAEPMLRARLAAKRYVAIMIGAGVRTIPSQFLLFENMINLVHAEAPDAKLCFNTSPDSTREAVLRWVQP